MTLIVNPFLEFDVPNGWSAGHPAIDYATPVGFDFVSPADGKYVHRPSELSWTPGFAGIYGDLVLDDGRWIRFCHLNRHLAKHNSRVKRGLTLLAETGNTGYVKPRPTRTEPYNGAHMHTTGFYADGSRWNWTLEAIDPTTAGVVPSALASIEDEGFMNIITTSAQAVKYEYLRGNRKRSISKEEWSMLRRLEGPNFKLNIEIVTAAELRAIPGL